MRGEKGRGRCRESERDKRRTGGDLIRTDSGGLRVCRGDSWMTWICVRVAMEVSRGARHVFSMSP